MDSKETPFRLNALITTLLVAGAYWPVFIWLSQRTVDRSDEPWGIVALATAILLLLAGPENIDSLLGNSAKLAMDAGEQASKNIEETKIQSGRDEALSIKGQVCLPPAFEQLNVVLGTVCLLVYIAAFSVAPNLVQAVLFVLSMWFFVLNRLPSSSRAGMLGLFLLSLPLVPSLNFYAGYPIRVLVANGACLMLNVTGVMANVEGAMLSVRGKLVAIDAPCSGISMLWAEAYMVMLIACLFKLTARNTALLTLVGGLLIVFGNILRATTLVLFGVITETVPYHQFAHLEPTIHVGAGLLVFCVMSGLTFLAGIRLANDKVIHPHSIPAEKPKSSVSLSVISKSTLKRNLYVLSGLCALSALMPIVSTPYSVDSSNQTAQGSLGEAQPEWPSVIDGRKLKAVNANALEANFAKAFPGSMKQFTDGERLYLVRFVRSVTRQLHPSSDCFRGSGYKIEPRPIFVSQDGTTWGAFEATNTDTKYLVMERIYDERGVSTTDVSQWYWMACLGKTCGPWFDVTIAQRVGPQTTASK